LKKIGETFPVQLPTQQLEQQQQTKSGGGGAKHGVIKQDLLLPSLTIMDK
jgi:hypothetical protein